VVDSYATLPSPGGSCKATADVFLLEKEGRAAEALSTQDDDEKEDVCGRAADLGIPVQDSFWLAQVPPPPCPPPHSPHTHPPNTTLRCLFWKGSPKLIEFTPRLQR